MLRIPTLQIQAFFFSDLILSGISCSFGNDDMTLRANVEGFRKISMMRLILSD